MRVQLKKSTWYKIPSNVYACAVLVIKLRCVGWCLEFFNTNGGSRVPYIATSIFSLNLVLILN